jgi:Protein of unknown function (DUF2971)
VILERIYEPADGELLYHYCSSETFLAICQGKKLRFSDLYSMNDFLEIRWGYAIWEEAASRLLESFGEPFVDEVHLHVHQLGAEQLLLASCFSTDGDVLSQWRAYAEDGMGYCIGFDAKSILGMPVLPLQVLYERPTQVEETIVAVRTIHESRKNSPAEFKTDCGLLGVTLAAMKNPAFAEEKEVRLVHSLVFEESNGSLRLSDTGGTAFGEEADQEPIRFRMSSNTPVPFVDLDFSNKGAVSPIREVVIGPKNMALESGISVFLETTTNPKVRVHRSKSSYR